MNRLATQSRKREITECGDIMQDERIIVEGVYLIGGPDISRSEDAAAFVVDCGDELAMIDSGAGRSVEILENNIRELGA